MSVAGTYVLHRDKLLQFGYVHGRQSVKHVKMRTGMQGTSRCSPGLSRALPEIKERMGSLWTVELDVDRSRASPIFCGLARGEVRRAGVGVEESRSCELTDWALLRHGEEPVDGDAIVAAVVLSHESGGPEPHHPSNGALQ